MVSKVSSLHSKSLKNNPDGTKTRLIENFGQLLDEFSTEARTIHVCKRFGSVMQRVHATFYSWDGDRGWDTVLPICPKCEPDLALRSFGLDASRLIQ